MRRDNKELIQYTYIVMCKLGPEALGPPKPGPLKPGQAGPPVMASSGFWPGFNPSQARAQGSSPGFTSLNFKLYVMGSCKTVQSLR